MMNFYEPIENPEDKVIASLSALEVKPPMLVWRNISSSLDSKRHKKLAKGVTLAAAAAVSAIVGIGSMLLAGADLRVDSRPLEMARLSSSELPHVQLNANTASLPKPQTTYSAPVTSQIVPNTATSNSVGNKAIEPQPLRMALLESRLPKGTIAHKPFPSFLVNEVKLPATQEKRALAPVKNPWRLSFSGAPVYAFHSDGAFNQFKTDNEAGIWSWGFDLLVGYQTRKGFSLHTGIAISPIGQHVGDVFLVDPNYGTVKVKNYKGASTSLGYVTLSNTQQRLFDYPDMVKVSAESLKKSSVNLVAVQQTLSYLEIPVLVAKSFEGKYGSFFLRTGMSVGVLIGNKAEVFGANNSLNGKTVGINYYSYSWIGSLGFAIPVYGKVNLLVEPTFKLWLVPVNAPLGVSYPFSTTVKAGILIPF
ncbi:MAG: hypothetical protein JW783_16205 [Bacteroidales bacterium]|nr:hypothetical protein [Bacteroidales bacterium]MBN2750682.1 hypothetical protein [Bacteroidales bacterium]